VLVGPWSLDPFAGEGALPHGRVAFEPVLDTGAESARCENIADAPRWPSSVLCSVRGAPRCWDQHDIVAEEVLELACLDRLFEAS